MVCPFIYGFHADSIIYGKICKCDIWYIDGMCSISAVEKVVCRQQVPLAFLRGSDVPAGEFVHAYLYQYGLHVYAVNGYDGLCAGECLSGRIYRKNSLWLSGGIILCALSYYNAYGFILSSILLFIVYFLQQKDGRYCYDWKEMLKKGSFISAIVLLGIGWWFIRSYILLDGDILGLATRDKMVIQYGIPEVNPLTMATYQNRGYTVWQMMRENSFLEGAFYSFVAAYGSMSIYGNIWMYRLFKVFFFVGIASCILLGIRQGRKGRLGERIFTVEDSVARGGWGLREQFSIPKWKKIFFHCNMVFCILMPLFLLIYYAYSTDYQNQGRYLLPAVIPMMYYVIRGLQKLAHLKWVPRWLQNIGVWMSVILLVGSTIWMVYGIALPIYLQGTVL